MFGMIGRKGRAGGFSGRTPVAKADAWPCTDAEARRCGEQTGLDTLVVRTVNDVHWPSGAIPVAKQTR